jgi:hypothetical protein
MKMKRSLTMDMGRLAMGLGALVLLISLTGCSNRMKLLNARLDAAHKRLDAVSDDLKTYDEESRGRSAEQEIALKKVERSLTSRFTGEIKAVDAASKRRSAAHEIAMSDMEAKLTEQIALADAAGKERSAGHEAALRELEDSLSAKLAVQRQAFFEENANLRKSLYALRTEIDKINDADAKTQRVLANTASKEALAGLIKDVHKRHSDTQQALKAIVKSSVANAQISTDIRTAMQRLIEAHAFFVKGGADLIAALEAEKEEGKAGTEGVYLGILYEQRKAQQRLLKEMQVLLMKAAGEIQDTPEADDA